jgi:uncharacterized membrane protein YeiH
MLHLLDMMGALAFAFLGAQQAMELRFNAFGAICFGAVTAVGGGTLREILLNHLPFYLYDYSYLLMILAGCGCAAFLRSKATRPHLKATILTLDALGTATVAFMGAHAATTAHLGLPAITLFAVLTAFGGSTLCDIAAHRPPRVFKRSYSIIPSLCLSLAVWAQPDIFKDPLASMSLLGMACLGQLGIVYWRTLVRLWRRLAAIELIRE